MLFDFNKNNFGAKIDGSQENIYQGTPDYTDQKLPGIYKIMPTKFVWTPELHELYMSAVDKLGGPEVGIATPISILHEMQKLNQHSCL